MVAATAAAKNKKQTHINDIEDMLATKFPEFKNALQKVTFSPVLFGPITLIINTTFMRESAGIGRIKRVLDLVMLSTRDGKSVHKTEVGRDVNAFRRSIVKTYILNSRIYLFEMFSVPAAGEEEYKIQNWQNYSSVFDFFYEKAEDACFPHDVKSERAASRRIFNITNGLICPMKHQRASS